jgi:hypothetical protein
MTIDDVSDECADEDCYVCTSTTCQCSCHYEQLSGVVDASGQVHSDADPGL